MQKYKKNILHKGKNDLMSFRPKKEVDFKLKTVKNNLGTVKKCLESK